MAADGPGDTPIVYTRKDATDVDITMVIGAIADIANAMHRVRWRVGIRPERRWHETSPAKTLRSTSPSEAYAQGGQTPEDILAAQRALDAAVPAEQWVGVVPIPGVEPRERPLMLTIGDLVLDAARELAGPPTERMVHKFQAGSQESENGPWIGLFAMRLDSLGLFWEEVEDALTRAVWLMGTGNSEVRAWIPDRSEATVWVVRPYREPSLWMACSVYVAIEQAGRQAVTEDGLSDRVLAWVHATIHRILKNRMTDDYLRGR